LFTAMMEAIREESIGYIFNVEVQVDEAPDEEGDPGISARGLAPPDRPSDMHYSGPTIDGDQAEIHFDEHLDLDMSEDGPADDGPDSEEAAYAARMSRAERRAAKRQKS
jgi:preprotein translocase subunit SecA